MYKIKALFIASLLLLSTQSIMAKDKDLSFWEITKKVGKKIILVPAVVVSGVAGAVEEYQDGGDTLDVIGKGLQDGGSKIADSIEETADDIGRIKDVVVEEYQKND